MRFLIEPDHIELEATHQIVLPVAALPGIAAGQFAELRNGSHSGAAIVARTAVGNTVALDKYLRIHLHAKVGDEVEMKLTELQNATKVELVVPAELERRGFTSLLLDCLVDKPFSAGQPVPLFVTALTGDQSLGEVSSTEPVGHVVVTRDTKLSLCAGRVGDAGVTYDRIGGLEREIAKIREAVEYPLRTPELFRRLGITPTRGVLLHGPPGTGKTLITKALAHEIGASVHTIQGPEIISGWYGGAEHNLRSVFDSASAQAPRSSSSTRSTRSRHAGTRQPARWSIRW